MTYRYDDPAVDFSLGRLTAIERHGQSVDYQYDRFGRTTQDGELTYVHDANGNRVEIGYPGGVTATYSYDFADRPATLDVDPGTGTPEPVVTSSSYLPSGPLASLTHVNGTTETRTYNRRYAPLEILLDAPRPHRWTYATDGAGNITQISEEIGCLEADLVLTNQTVTTAEAFESCAAIEAGPAFAVEAPGDVTFTAGTRVVLRDGFSVGSGASLVAGTDPALAGGTETKTFQYQDVQYFLTGAELPWTSLTWTYDQIGNRLTETRDGTTDTYAYVVNGSSGNTALLDQVTLGVGGTRDYTFGAAGHLEEVAAGANVVDFVSDGEGRLSEVARTGAGSSPFVYDGRSFLSQAGDLATVGTTRPVYASDGHVMALRRQGSAAEPELTDVVLYFAGRPVAQLEVGGPAPRWWYFTVDHLGTPQVATDETGEELWAARLEPFGEDSARGTPDGALENGVFLRLPGQWETGTWQDAALGAEVYYNVHRWYQPGTGSYSRPDPLAPVNTSISFAGPSASGDRSIEATYGYVQMNPLLRIDPLGLKSRVCCRKIPWVPASHCFIQIEQDGETTTCGLHGGRFSSGEEAGVGQIRGPNDFDDPTESDCGPWNEDCGTDDCVVNTANNYANPSVYGAVRKSNSNSFAGNIARECGLTRPEGIAKPRGWNRPPAVPKPGREKIGSPCQLPGGGNG